MSQHSANCWKVTFEHSAAARDTAALQEPQDPCSHLLSPVVPLCPCAAVCRVCPCCSGMSDFGITTWAQQPYSHDFAVGSNRPRKVRLAALQQAVSYHESLYAAARLLETLVASLPLDDQATSSAQQLHMDASNMLCIALLTIAHLMQCTPPPPTHCTCVTPPPLGRLPGCECGCHGCCS